MTEPRTTNNLLAPTPPKQPTGFGTTRVIFGSVLCFLSVFSLPRGLSLLLLALVRPDAGTYDAATALGTAVAGAAILTAGILLIISGVKRRRAQRATK